MSPIEIIAYCIMAVTFFVAVARAQEEFMPKFICTAIIIAAFMGMKNYVDHSWSFSYIKAEVESLFWIKYLVGYLALGLVWFAVEAVLATKKIKEKLKKELDSTLTKSEKEVSDKFIQSDMQISEVQDEFIQKIVSKTVQVSNICLDKVKPHSFIQMNSSLKVYFNKSELFDFLMNVVVFFPLYIVEFIFGRFIKTVFEFITNFVVNVCGGAIRRYFKDILS